MEKNLWERDIELGLMGRRRIRSDWLSTLVFRRIQIRVKLETQVFDTRF